MKTAGCLMLALALMTGTAMAKEPDTASQNDSAEEVSLAEALDLESANVVGTCYSARSCTGKILQRSTTPQQCKRIGGKSIKIGNTCARL